MAIGAALLEHGNIRIKKTRYGLMAYNINDVYIGRSLDLYGEYVSAEAAMFSQIATPGSTVLDIGANIGAHTLSLAQSVGPNGSVIAIEPQRTIFQLLCANLALNEIGNVRAIHAGAGRTNGQAIMPSIDYSKLGNFGGVPLGAKTGYRVEIITIDGLDLPACHLIKIDVEGHESNVIVGAVETIKRCKPALYVENDRREQSADLINQLLDLDYRLYWDLPALYRKDNFFQNPTNVFPGIISSNMLGLASGDARRVAGLKPVSGPQDWPLAG